MASSAKKAAVLVLLAAAAGAALWWGWGELQKHELRRTVGALVQRASASLSDGLKTRGDAGKLEEDAKRLDAGITALERVKAAPERSLVYAAEEYALAARQILRNLAQEQRQRLRVSENMQLLAQHINHAERRTPDFHRQALRLKDELERAYFDYRVAADGLGRELYALPGTRAKLAAQLGAAPLVDEALVDDALRRSADTAQGVADRMQRARLMVSAR
jgi:hypothetical protein